MVSDAPNAPGHLEAQAYATLLSAPPEVIVPTPPVAQHLPASVQNRSTSAPSAELGPGSVDIG